MIGLTEYLYSAAHGKSTLASLYSGGTRQKKGKGKGKGKGKKNLNVFKG